MFSVFNVLKNVITRVPVIIHVRGTQMGPLPKQRKILKSLIELTFQLLKKAINDAFVYTPASNPIK